MPTIGIGVGIIGTILSQNGFEVKIIDNNSLYKHYSNDELLKIVKSFQPNIVGFSINMLNAIETYNLATRIKKKFADIFLIAGGIHMLFSYEEAHKHRFDIIVLREGEKVVIPLFEHLRGKNKADFREGLDSIPGISYVCKDGTIFVSNKFPAITELDEVPIVNYDLFNISDYRKTKKEPAYISLLGQRGCPFRCSFCSHEIQRKDRRIASSRWLFKNVKALYNKYDVHYIPILDNNFTIQKKRVIEFCNMLIQSGFNKKITLSCQTKVETPLDDDILSLMKEAGFKRIYVGLERMEPFSLKMIKKVSSLKKIYHTLSMIKKYDMEIGIYILLGFPFETAALLRKERDAFLKLKKFTQVFSCSILQPCPGTEYYDYPKVHEWYLDKKTYQLRRSYFANVFDIYMLGQVDLNYFDLSEETRKEIKNLYKEFKKLSFGTHVPEKTPFYLIMLKIDWIMAKISQLMFHLSSNLEFKVFNRLRAFRYYFGTLFFGKKV